MPATLNSLPIENVIAIAITPHATTLSIDLILFDPLAFALMYPVKISANITEMNVSGIDNAPVGNMIAISGIVAPDVYDNAEANTECQGFVKCWGSMFSSIAECASKASVDVSSFATASAVSGFRPLFLYNVASSFSSYCGLSRSSRFSLCNKACSLSLSALTEMYSPAAIDIAPAAIPANPAVRIKIFEPPALAIPITNPDIDRIPSFDPITAARRRLDFLFLLDNLLAIT